MANDILFVGLDVHKKTISVATVLERPGETCRYYGSIPNTPDALRRLCQKLQADDASLYFCYEAGAYGYGVQRLLTRLGHRCDVVAPTLIPRKAGDRVKNDRRDAMSLAQSLRAGHLTEVWVPDEAHEAMRELVRLQALAKRDIHRARQQLLSFLLRHGVHYPGRHWSKAHRRWLSTFSFEHPTQHLVLEELVQRAEVLGERIEQSMVELLPRWTLAPVVEAVQTLRGISMLNAITLIAEIGSFGRFENPRQLMAYLGLVPSEHSSGSSTRRGPITKAGNSLARTCLVEAAWSYRFPTRVSRIIFKRTEHLPEPIRAVGWKAQVRLCRRYRHLMASGKAAPKVVTAIARELVGFIWAIARMVEPVRT